ncbi:MAG TPA: COX15/CtaA family protein [Opitutaceae bacterium]|nr:COX15/CtaA family protein [Opitutaceae bacterium]
MVHHGNSHRTSTYKPALAWFATLGSAWVFVLVMLGAFTTTIGAGMAFQDWPLSNGSINPKGWLTNIAMFAEHSHRLSGTMMGLITIVLAIWVARVETRGWVRKLAWTALVIVVIQGILGGTRVKLDAVYLGNFQMSVGQFLRIPHGILAQLYVVNLFAIAASLSKSWIQAPLANFAVSKSLRRLGVICTALVIIQLMVAATMRHFYAGLAIPTFPLTPEGTLIPTVWNFRIAIHFAHRAMALVIFVALIWYAVAIFRERAAALFRTTAVIMVALLLLQIFLGIAIIKSVRDPYFTTAHVIVGAVTLGVTFLLSWFAHRNQLQSLPANPVEHIVPPAEEDSVHLPGSTSTSS